MGAEEITGSPYLQRATHTHQVENTYLFASKKLFLLIFQRIFPSTTLFHLYETPGIQGKWYDLHFMDMETER